MFKKFLSILLIFVLVFSQSLFYVPFAFAQEATPSATQSTEPSPSPSPEVSPSPEPSSIPNPITEPSPTSEASSSATPTPSPSPSPDISPASETSSSAVLKTKQTPTEKKIKKTSGKNYVEGQVLVKFKESKINLKQASSISKAKEFAEVKNLNLEETIEKSNVAVLETKGESVENAIDRLEDDSNVQYAEPNYIRTPSSIVSNDTFKDRLWGLDNTGQSVDGVTGTNDADMDSPESWGLSEGNSNIIVAIIDSGVDYNHPDLQINMWDGTSCKDENGVVLNNCNHGYDFEENDKTPLPSNSSHGTHIAGTIAAVKNNNKGIIGVAPSVKIMALKYGFDVASEVRAVDFAIQNGAKIINASYAGSYSQTEYDAINRFKAAGGIFITVAGNETVNNDAGTHSYPSDYDLDNIISVTATDQNDNLADFSNYGATSVDVAAPGVNIYSTVADIISSDVLDESFTSVAPPTIPSDWVKTGNWGTYDFGDQIWGKVLYGDLALPYASNANSTITSATYNLSDSSGAEIGFWAACDTEYVTDGWHDYMALEVSSDGTDFTEIMKWDEAYLDDDLIESNNGTNGITVDYLTQSIPTNYFTSNFVFRLRWVTDGDSDKGTDGDGCKVDDILITKHTLGSSELYEFKDGTSMAAPHVAGLAALILSHNSSRTYSQVKSIILNTGDTKASLSGKTVSGKRVNANNALLATNGPAISGLSNDTSSTKSKTWNWSSTDSTATFRFAIDQSSSWTPTGDYSSTATATQGSGNGTYYIHVQAKNSSGIESDVMTVSAVIDNTNPAVPGTPIPSPSSPTNQTTQTWNWTTSTDNIAGTITYFWSIINAATSTLFDTGTTTNTSLVTNLLQGVWNLIVNAKDNAGNQSATTTGSVTVDTTAPNAPTSVNLTSPINNSNKTSVTITGTGEANNNFTYSVTDGVNAAVTGNGTVASNGSISVSGINVSGLNEGTLTASVTLTDAAGNTGSAGSDIATKDVSTPTLSNVSISSDNANSTALAKVGNIVTISFTSTETIQTPTITIAENAALVSNTGGNNWRADYQMDSGDSSGTVPFTINFNDLGGNPGSEVSTTGDNTSITFDKTNPNNPVISSVATDDKINNSEKAAIVVAGTAEANSLISVTLSDGTNSKSGTQQLTGGDTSFSIAIDGTTATPGALVDGSITPSVTAADAAGNVSPATSTPTAIQDTVAPTGTFTMNNAVAYTNSTSVTLNFSGVSFDVTQIQTANGDSVFSSNAAYSSSYSYTLPNTQGTRTVQVKLIDGTGNISGIISDTIILDSINPVIAIYTLDNIRISPEASVGIKDTASFDLLFSEEVTADFDILNSGGTKVKDIYGPTIVTNPQAKTWDGKDNSNAYVAQGIYTIKIVMTDRANNSITDTSKTITVNNAPLSLNPIGNKSVNEGSELTFTAQADDEEGGTLTFSLTGTPTGATINPSTGAFSWTPTEVQGEGSYTFTVSVSSTTGTNASEEIVVTVNEVNIAPVASGSTQTTDEDTAKVITLSATDVDLPANTLVYSMVSGPSHGTLSAVSGNSVTYTPAANYNGSDSFTFRVNDGPVNSNTATINITVNAVNDSPTIAISSPNGTEVWVGGSSHDITWNASDADNDSEDLVIDLYYTTNGTEFTKIDTGLNNTGDYTWDPVDSLDSSTVKIKAVVTDPDDATGTDLSNANFTIDSTAPTVPGTPSTSPNPTKSATQTWNWTAATDTLSGVASYFWSVVNNANSQIVDSGTTAGNILSASTSLLQGVWNFIVGAQDNAGNQSSTSTDQLVVDTTVPTVTKLGNGSVDVVLLSPGNINLVFSEVLSNNSKTVVENALTAGADKALTYSWSGGTLTITTTEIPTFANDVVVNVSDIAGNLADLLLVDSALASTQKAPDSEGAVTVDNTTPQVVITNPTQTVNITISSETTDPRIDVSSFISEGTGTLPKITMYSEKAEIAIPASTIVTSANTTWNGVIAAPTVATVTLPETSGETKTVSTAIEIGFTGAKLSFDKAVRILLPGQAGKRAGYIRTGIAFTEISSTCFADNQTAGDALVTDGECKIDAGSDLVIWTKHFTKFLTYTQTTIASSTINSSGSDGGGSSASSCTDQKPGNAPVLLSAVTSGINSVTLTWSEAKDPVTYYLVAYGTASGIVQYGNPNIGGKGTTSYTVQGLSGRKAYYFKVRAGNGCTPGDFSNEVSATPAGVFITAPATGFKEGVLGESTDQPDQQQNKEEKGQEGTVKGVETIPTESSQEVGSFAQRNWPWMAVVILIISGTGYHLFIRRR